jgi:hypothetical protein
MGIDYSRAQQDKMLAAAGRYAMGRWVAGIERC